MLEWQGDSGSEHQAEELQEKIGRMLASASPALVTMLEWQGNVGSEHQAEELQEKI